MKPHVSILMLTSADGSLHPSRFTTSPEGTRRDWSAQYEKVHASLKGNAWLVGRVTMAEMSKSQAHVPPEPWKVQRPIHMAGSGAPTFGIALDPGGKVHFQGGKVAGDDVIVLLGPDVPDSHLAELAADGVSYIVSQSAAVDIPAALEVLARDFGVRHLIVEGGAATNGAFLAAGVVDDFHVLIAPAMEGPQSLQGIVSHRDGLAGRVEFRLQTTNVLDHGVVQLTYEVSSYAVPSERRLDDK
jgi:riboflavin biosynthesis pyrimidine reductase